MRAFAIALLVSCAVGTGAGISYGQEYATAVGDVPQSLSSLRFGMPLSDVQRLFPEAKGLGSVGSRFALFITPKDSRVWDSAMLEFIGGKLEAMNFLLGEKRTADLLQRSSRVLTGLIERNGAACAHEISLNSSQQLVPACVWNKQEFMLFAVGPSAAVSGSGDGRELFPADPELRVGVARPTRNVKDFVEIATVAQMQEMLFKLLSPVGK